MKQQLLTTTYVLPKPTKSSSVTRTDIQWMRALAVGLVLFYHLWPNRVSGGFVGVDIFLVISGFLITTNLLNKPPRHLRDVAAFWGRRVRRLLPVAFTVIIVTLIMVVLFAPMTRWMDNAWAGIASALYIENWDLAAKAVDYLGAAQAPTAFQHYWSLSVEEQFYLLWPLLILGSWLLVRQKSLNFRAGAGVVIGAVVAGSFVYCVYLSAVNPAAAYFVTPTRMWELGAGGFLAVIYPQVQKLLRGRAVITVALVGVGTLMMAWSGLFINVAGFPGWIASVPIVGAMVVIGAGPVNGRFFFDRVLGWRGIQHIGDISYSIYLWHWPFIVLSPWVVGHRLNGWEKLALIAVVIAVSSLSKALIEDRFRGSRPLGVPLRRTWIFLVTGMLVTSLVAASVMVYTQVAGHPNEKITLPVGNISDDEIPEPVECIGAVMLLDPWCETENPHGEELLMTPLQAAEDKSISYADDCKWSSYTPQKFPTCRYGAKSDDAPRIALMGNSHADPYLNPLIDMAQEHGWSVRTYLAQLCFPSLVTLSYPGQKAMNGCRDYTTRAISDMKKNGTDVVILSVQSDAREVVGVNSGGQYQAKFDIFADLLGQLLDADMTVIVIRDVPFPPDNVTDCVDAHLDDLSACDGPRAGRIVKDPLYDAAVGLEDPRVFTVDFTDAICDDTTCFDVVGGVIVYFNQGHLTKSFASTLRPYLEPVILEALR
ncbi:MAG: acyltransferase [Propionibacteriaceae bacterium]|nr:acyltransferase [Propionibacteriaceae bacterium]